MSDWTQEQIDLARRGYQLLDERTKTLMERVQRSIGSAASDDDDDLRADVERAYYEALGRKHARECGP